VVCGEPVGALCNSCSDDSLLAMILSPVRDFSPTPPFALCAITVVQKKSSLWQVTPLQVFFARTASTMWNQVVLACVRTHLFPFIPRYPSQRNKTQKRETSRQTSNNASFMKKKQFIRFRHSSVLGSRVYLLTKYMYVLEMSTYLQVLTDWCVWCSGVRDYY
jgi:hypothetical protein